MTDAPPFLINFPMGILALGVLVVLLLLRKGLRLVRLRKPLQARLDRILPYLELVVGVLYLIWVTSIFVRLGSVYAWVILGGGLLILAWASWFAIKDLVSGVILRAENAYQGGQWIRVGRTEGRIRQVGYRVLVVETEDGLQVKIPYGKISSMPSVTSDQTETSKAHTFRLSLPDTFPVAEAIQQIRTTALNAFWSSLTRAPHIQLTGQEGPQHVFEVTVYGLDETHVFDVEETVRSHFMGDIPSVEQVA